MSREKKHTERRYAAGIVRCGGELRAVLVGKGPGGIELLNAVTAPAGRGWAQVNRQIWETIAGLAEAEGDKQTIVGCDSTGAVFYRMTLPAVKDSELESMVTLQAEALLPLPPKQMELDWRRRGKRDKQVDVTIAAARSSALQRFVGEIGALEPAKIVLDCEGLVKIGRMFCEDEAAKFILIRVDQTQTRICLVESGLLAGAVTIEVGFQQLANNEGRGGAKEEMFAQDVRSSLENFGLNGEDSIPVYILSDGSQCIARLAEQVRRIARGAKTVMVKPERLAGAEKLSAEQLYPYLEAAGLATAGLEQDGDELDLFNRLYTPPGARRKVGKSRLRLRVTATAAVLMFAVFLAVSYAIDRATLARLKGYMNESQVGANLSRVIEKEQLRSAVARERPDMLALLSAVNIDGASGILLDAVNFEKGRPVSVNGQADSYEQLYNYQQQLRNESGIREVRILNSVRDDRSRKVNFTINFAYRHFSEGRTGLRL